MKTYTGSQLRMEIGNVLSDVQVDGVVKISNRNRPDMLLITEAAYKAELEAANKIGYSDGQENTEAYE